MKLAWKKRQQHSTNIETSWSETGWSHLCVSSGELAATTRRNIVNSLVIQLEILLVFKGKSGFLSHENGMEEATAFHEY
jgi:hypothetical protein